MLTVNTHNSLIKIIRCLTLLRRIDPDLETILKRFHRLPSFSNHSPSTRIGHNKFTDFLTIIILLIILCFSIVSDLILYKLYDISDTLSITLDSHNSFFGTRELDIILTNINVSCDLLFDSFDALSVLTNDGSHTVERAKHLHNRGFNVRLFTRTPIVGGIVGHGNSSIKISK